MPIVILIACSILVFIHARRKGRSGIFWIVLLWISCITMGAAVYVLNSFSSLNRPPSYLAYITTIVGTLPIFILVNRNPSDKSKQHSKY
jgi:uncharacterized protein YqgC (DUF456 family)